MRNLKFVRYNAVLLGLVVLCTNARNRFCPMCTKGCHTVLTRSKPFWGQFWGQICETDSHTHRSNKCAALVPLRNADTNITRFSHRKSPTNRYIRFTFRQEIVRKYHATAAPHTTPVAARNAPVWARSHHIGTVSSQIPPQIPRLWGFLTQERLFLCRLCPDGFHLYRKSLH